MSETAQSCFVSGTCWITVTSAVIGKLTCLAVAQGLAFSSKRQWFLWQRRASPSVSRQHPVGHWWTLADTVVRIPTALEVVYLEFINNCIYHSIFSNCHTFFYLTVLKWLLIKFVLHILQLWKKAWAKKTASQTRASDWSNSEKTQLPKQMGG